MAGLVQKLFEGRNKRSRPDSASDRGQPLSQRQRLYTPSPAASTTSFRPPQPALAPSYRCQTPLPTKPPRTENLNHMIKELQTLLETEEVTMSVVQSLVDLYQSQLSSIPLLRELLQLQGPSQHGPQGMEEILKTIRKELKPIETRAMREPPTVRLKMKGHPEYLEAATALQPSQIMEIVSRIQTRERKSKGSAQQQIRGTINNAPDDGVHGHEQSCWDAVLGARIDRNVLKIFCKDDKAVQDIYSRSNIVCQELKLGELEQVPENYYVEVHGLRLSRAEFEQNHNRNEAWGKENSVKIVHSARTFGRTVLTLTDEKGALRLCNEWVYLSGSKVTAEAVDIRSVPLFCQRCPNCKNEGVRDLKDQGHAAWSPECQSVATQRMFDNCKQLASVKVPWASPSAQRQTTCETCQTTAPPKTRRNRKIQSRRAAGEKVSTQCVDDDNMELSSQGEPHPTGASSALSSVGGLNRGDGQQVIDVPVVKDGTEVEARGNEAMQTPRASSGRSPLGPEIKVPNAFERMKSSFSGVATSSKQLVQASVSRAGHEMDEPVKRGRGRPSGVKNSAPKPTAVFDAMGGATKSARNVPVSLRQPEPMQLEPVKKPQSCLTDSGDAPGKQPQIFGLTFPAGLPARFASVEDKFPPSD
ncbi:hypothetical protein CABS01_14034 [Colletotrichum abscissum]|uniref:Uncharacterized protein n=1 Tax=Colletotrichum abscissum TaxID=1671311 RepID=A0A9Q0AWB9_9PEZI|nr:uncharacterized protein CABS01_14034 [Colletotrichum abscissum]KAI3528725.1 hypothetical protein CABS02_15037 [Colletotrichum abscissum]KAK1482336.1 hypothetical protein CABS01_14034 [Colletotrichum abscissum]